MARTAVDSRCPDGVERLSVEVRVSLDESSSFTVWNSGSPWYRRKTDASPVNGDAESDPRRRRQVVCGEGLRQGEDGGRGAGGEDRQGHDLPVLPDERRAVPEAA